jgi:hypothetical protein
MIPGGYRMNLTASASPAAFRGDVSGYKRIFHYRLKVHRKLRGGIFKPAVISSLYQWAACHEGI